ncbi:MAG: MATE family efflux transporter [Treponema sp.]|nr:MATE family efflux transporter [Treponema sp.]
MSKLIEKDLTTGSLSRGIFFYSLPLMFSNILQVLFNIADIAVAGRFAGPLALGAVGSTSHLLFLFTGILMGIGGGVNVIVAFYIGAKSKESMDLSVHSSFLISLIAGLLLMFIGLIFANPVLVLIKTKPELLEGAVLYFKIYMLGIPGVAVFNYGNAVLSAAGDTKRPLFYLTAAGVINVILNLIFVISFNMSCAGVALASTISQYISALLVMAAIFKGLGNIKFSFRKLSLNREISIKLLKIGIPAGLQNAIFSVANTFIQVGVNSFNAIMVAGTAACSNLDNIVYSTMNGFYTACATFIGQNYGAGKKDRIIKSMIIANVYAFVIGAIESTLMYIFGHQCFALFTTDPAVIEAGMLRFGIMFFSLPVASFMDNTIAANRGLGKTFVPSIIVLIGSCFFRIAWIYTVFAYFKTIPSLFLLYIFSWIITAIAEMIYFFKQYRNI